MVDLIAVGYSLGLAASVLYLGALGDRYGRKTMLLLGMALTIPASLLAAFAPTAEVLFVARVLGGVAAGMAYPTTLALITALWSGPERTKSIALWSALGGGVSALGPLLAGALLEGFDWGSVFIVSAAAGGDRPLLRLELVPAHVNETTEPVDHLGGILSIAMVGDAGAGDQPRAGTRQGHDRRSSSASSPSAAAGAFVLRQRRVTIPLYDLEIAGRGDLLGRGLAGIIVFGSLMGAMFIGQQFLQNVLGYSTLEAGLAILPGAVGMVIVAPRSAKLVELARLPLHPAGRLRLLPARLPRDAAALGRGRRLLGGRPRLPADGDRRRLRRHPGLALADRLGAGQARRHGLRHRRPPARPRRRDHAVDLRRPADRRLRRQPSAPRSPPRRRPKRSAKRSRTS